jgi:ParB/RepB/Spo0J family partition protein
MLDISKYQERWVGVNEINSEDQTYQYKGMVSENDIHDMAVSMAEHGQLVAVVLLENENGEKIIVSGFTRVLAAKNKGWEKVNAKVIPLNQVTQKDLIEYSIIENKQRGSFNKMREIFACKKMSENGISNVEIGKLIGKSESQIRNYLKVANASQDVQNKVASGETTIKKVSQLAPGCDDNTKNKKMYVKTSRSGFYAVLKFDRKRDNPQEAITFAQELIKKIKDEVTITKIKLKSKRKAKHKMTLNPQLTNVLEACAAQNPFIIMGEAKISEQIAQIQDALSMFGISETDADKLREGLQKMQDALNQIKQAH